MAALAGQSGVAPPNVGYLLSPRRGPGVCQHCWNLTEPGAVRCRACRQNERHVELMLAVSYCLARSRLHHELSDYKRIADPSVPAVTDRLARLLDRFLARHEPCVCAALGASAPLIITTVPSGSVTRDRQHPLRRIVGELCGHTRERHRRLLVRTDMPALPHVFDRRRYRATEPLPGAAVLLIDDVWTTGASAESAAAALRAAGAETVAVVTIGRYLNGDWRQASTRISEIAVPFDFTYCSLCAPQAGQPSGFTTQ
jgi:predicted amidophosphoribosyltransferase